MDNASQIPDIMDSKAGKYGIPGLKTSQGDRILLALSKLWSKILLLEQAKQKETKDAQTSFSDESSGESLDDIQLRLLESQLKYVRRLQKRKSTKSFTIATSTANGSPSKDHSFDDENFMETVPFKLEKETQTSRISSQSVTVADGHHSLNKKPHSGQKFAAAEGNVSKRTYSDLTHAAGDRSASDKAAGSSSASLANALKTCPHSHYHVRLPDVPFIIGKSATASHSLTANVQSIIGMMKCHNSGLCTGPGDFICAPETSKVIEENTKNQQRLSQGHDEFRQMKRQLKKLALELSELTLKQEVLNQKLKEDHPVESQSVIIQEHYNISKLMESKARTIAEFYQVLKKQGAKRRNQKAGKDRNLNLASSETDIQIVKAKGPIKRKLVTSGEEIEHITEDDLVWT